MEAVVTAGTIRCAKLLLVITNNPSSSFLQEGCSSCRRTKSVKALPEISWDII